MTFEFADYLPRMISIDPGKSGAVAFFYKGRLDDVRDIPTEKVKIGKFKRTRILWVELANMLQSDGYESAPIVCEQLQVIGTNGALAAFSHGEFMGFMQGMAIGRHSCRFVRPHEWKKALGLSSEKGESLELARRMFPDHEILFRRKKDNDRAEAALIGHFALYL